MATTASCPFCSAPIELGVSHCPSCAKEIPSGASGEWHFPAPQGLSLPPAKNLNEGARQEAAPAPTAPEPAKSIPPEPAAVKVEPEPAPVEAIPPTSQPIDLSLPPMAVEDLVVPKSAPREEILSGVQSPGKAAARAAENPTQPPQKYSPAPRPTSNPEKTESRAAEPAKTSGVAAFLAFAAVVAMSAGAAYVIFRPENDSGGRLGGASPFSAGSSQSEAAAPPAMSPPALPEAKKSTGDAAMWSFEGTAFDLITGEGVMGVKIELLDDSGKVAGDAETDEAGRYRVFLPISSSGYTARVRHTNYGSKFFDDGESTTNLRAASAEVRRAMLSQTPAARPWLGVTSTSITHDLALFPLRTP